MPKLAKGGMTAAAITDHGNMFGAIDFYRSAEANNIKPIIGCEVYIAPRSRLDRSPVASDDYETGGNNHLILLASNLDGYRNLSKLVSQAYLDGFYYKPRIDKELLREFNSGLICLSGCLSGEVAVAIAAKRYERAREIIAEYESIFGDRYYLEIQDNHIEAQKGVNEFLIPTSKEMGIPLVATNDCHYLEHDDHHAHEVLLCVQTGKSINDESRWHFDTDQLYVKGPAEMEAAFADAPGAVATSVEIAERCNLELSFGRYQFPVYATDHGITLDEQLAREAKKGLEARFEQFRARGLEVDEAAYRERLVSEISMIEQMGFSGYFLIVADFINWAKHKGIPVGPGRGSAAGSLASYALNITDIDPIPYNLLFERFLNPERKSMPDIDVDFCYERREEVLDYVREKYGQDRVAHIITFGTLKGKAALRDVGRALDFSFAETDRICKLYPAPKQGRDFPLQEALKMEPRLRQVRDSGEREGKLFEYALKLEGLARHVSKHAAGLVISARPLVDDVPLFVDKEGAVMTQFAGPDIEAIGLIKFDFLGLKTLTLLDHTLRLIRETTGDEIDLSSLPLDDPMVYRTVTRADTVGIFQMESGGMRKLLTQLKAKTFEDLIAVLALFRPGPLDSGMVEQYIKRRDGKETIRYPDETLRSILSETWGVIVYQEQVMQIAQVYAGYSLGDADNLRRAMGKKKAEAMAVEKKRFIDGAAGLGHSAADAEQIFQQMETFAAYGFNKSHSAAYALISYQTAYLKTHYPRQFMAALLSMEMGDTDRTIKNLGDCRQRGIHILPPCVNSSEAGFTVCDEGIRFGLAAVKGVGEKAIEVVAEAREEGPFKSLADFCLRASAGQVNRRLIESLIKSGAFDSIEPSRARLMAGLDSAIAWAQRVLRDRDSGQIGLFGASKTESEKEESLPEVDELDDAARLEAEHEVVGFYISGHPLDSYTTDLEFLTAGTTADLGSKRDQDNVKVAGVTNTLRRKNSRKGDRYATFNLEDRDGVVEVIAWPETYKKCEAVIVKREPVLVTGKLELGEAGIGRAGDSEDGGNDRGPDFTRKPQIIADDIIPLVEARRRQARFVDLWLNSGDYDASRIVRDLEEALLRFPGSCRPCLHVKKDGESETMIELSKELSIDPTDGFFAVVETLLGPGSATLR